MGFGLKEIIIIGIIVLILFGAGKISKFMKELGKGASSFKAGMREGEAEEKKAVTKKPAAKKGSAKTKSTSKK